MTKDEAFLAAICDNPHDDAVRLIYADWLDDHGDPARAEFVRVQCELAGLPEIVKVLPQAYRPAEIVGGFGVALPLDALPLTKAESEFFSGLADRAQVLRQRERELYERHGRWWLHQSHPMLATPPLGALLPSHAGFCRGFVEQITCTLADWLGHGPSVVRTQPVTEVRLSDRRPTRGGLQWGWGKSTRGTAPDVVPYTLPPAVFTLMVDGRENAGAVIYDTEADALGAASAACVAWARDRAGLCPIRVP